MRVNLPSSEWHETDSEPSPFFRTREVQVWRSGCAVPYATDEHGGRCSVRGYG